MTLSGTDCEPKLRNIKLTNGEKEKGWIGFRVPASATGLTVSYTHRPPRENRVNPPQQLVKFKLE